MDSFWFKRNSKVKKKNPFQKSNYIMNPGIFGTQAYSEPWNIQKFDSTDISVKYFVMFFRNSSRL